MNTDLILNARQKAAVELGLMAANQPGAVVRVSGEAGTGKTTMLRELIGQLQRLHPKAALRDLVALVAPTGRAAWRAQGASGMEASTIHRWLYSAAHQNVTGQTRFTPKEELPRPAANLVIVDEASMVTEQLWSDLRQRARALELSIMLIGDGFQLPPVSPPNVEPFSVFSPAFTVDDDVRLEEPQRHALESKILRTATRLRLADTWDDAIDLVRRAFPTLDPFEDPLDELAGIDEREGYSTVVIAHRNRTRMQLNQDIRAWLGIPRLAPPREPEMLLVRRNAPEVGVFNGDLMEFKGWTGRARMLRGIRFGPTTINGEPCFIAIDAVVGAIPELGWTVARDVQRQLHRPLVSAQLGYVLTCHAAQGGEWNRAMIVLEDSLEALPEIERIRWAYTAVTRARHQVLLANPPPARRSVE